MPELQNLQGSQSTIQDKDLLEYVVDILRQRRAYYEPQWYTSLWGYENNHFIGWNGNSKSIMKYPTKKRFFIQFPEVKKQVDGFQNLMMSSNPVYQVYPTDFSDAGQQEQARLQSLFLKQHYLDWHEDNVLHSMVHNAGVMPISFLEVSVSNEYDINLGEWKYTTVPRVYDAFDIAFDPRYLFDQQPAIIKIIRTTNDAIAKSKLYKDFQGSQVSSGIQDYKEIYYIDKFGSLNVRYSNRVILYECHIRDGNDIRIVTIDGSGRVMRSERMKNMPFWTIIPFQPSSGNAYQPSLLENLLPMNRSMDLVANRIESMTMKYVKGSYLMPASTQVSMSDEDGTILTYKGGIPPTVLQHPNLPDWAWQYLNFMQTSSERYGTNYMVLGGTPRGSQMRSAAMMEQTKQNTLLQQKMYMDNFTYTLKRSAEVMIYIESRLLNTPRQYTLNNAEMAYETKKFVGSDYYDAYKADPNVVPLPKTFDKLSVEIEDESMHGIEAKRATIERLSQFYPVIKAQAPELLPILDALFIKTGNIADVVANRDKAGTLLASPGFQNIVDNARNGLLDDMPQVKQAIGILAQALAQDPNIEKPSGNIPEGINQTPPAQQPVPNPTAVPNPAAPTQTTAPTTIPTTQPNSTPHASQQVGKKGA